VRLTGTRRLGAIVAALVIAVGVAVLAAGALQADAGAGTSSAARSTVLGPGPVTVKIAIHNSRFSVKRLRVHPHTTVEFVIVNRDPIGHEFIIGDAEVHARHADGHEASHPPVPGEVSIPPLETGVTTYELHTPGDVEFACHLPGHFQYGMVGWVTVVDR
jgi:uncharacterized cupredoxin-like copper-binding protein